LSPEIAGDAGDGGRSALLGGFKPEGGSGGGTAIAGAVACAVCCAGLAPIISFQRSRKALNVSPLLKNKTAARIAETAIPTKKPPKNLVRDCGKAISSSHP
jgi:hypothetical protein